MLLFSFRAVLQELPSLEATAAFASPEGKFLHEDREHSTGHKEECSTVHCKAFSRASRVLVPCDVLKHVTIQEDHTKRAWGLVNSFIRGNSGKTPKFQTGLQLLRPVFPSSLDEANAHGGLEQLYCQVILLQYTRYLSSNI